MSLLAIGLNADGFTFTIPQTWIYGILGSALAAILVLIFNWIKPYIVAHFGSVWRLRRAERALEEKSPGLWLAPSIKIQPPNDYQKALARSKPIIVIANLKGGVGKTTIVANLIGHYAHMKGKRVLAIDADFQGSLSAVVLSEAEYKNTLEQQADGNPSKSAQLVEGRDAAWIRNTSVEVEGIDMARCIPSYYTLSIMENRVMVEWLIAKRRDDIRYSLAKTLHDPAIQDRFDIILIDAPPRLTTACVQSLCAATHVLVPTVLDGLSSEASGGFVDQLRTNQALWPHLKLLGVVANMTNYMTADQDGTARDGSLAEFEDDARRAASDTVAAALEGASAALRSCASAPVLPIECFIPEKAEMGKAAGNRIAYLRSGGSSATKDLSRAFDRLGDEIDRRISATSNR